MIDLRQGVSGLKLPSLASPTSPDNSPSMAPPHSMIASPQPPVHLVLVGFELLGGCHLKA